MKLPVIVIVSLVSIAIVGLFALFMIRSPKRSIEPSRLVPTPTPSLKTLDLRRFSVQIPGSWRYVPQSGVDSYVGALKGDGITLLFDYGYYSNTLARDGDPKYTIRTESIDGRSVKIVRSNVVNRGITGIYIEDVQMVGTQSAQGRTLRMNMYGENVPEEKIDLVLTILRSIEFK